MSCLAEVSAIKIEDQQELNKYGPIMFNIFAEFVDGFIRLLNNNTMTFKQAYLNLSAPQQPSFEQFCKNMAIYLTQMLKNHMFIIFS